MYEDVKGVARGADKARLASWVSDSSELGYTLRPYPTQPLFAMSSGLQLHHLLSLKTKQFCEAMLKQTGKDIISIYHMTTISSYAKTCAKNTRGLYFFKKSDFF